LPGIVLGLFAGIIPGQGLAALLLRSMGAYGFRFIIDPMAVFVMTPFLVMTFAIIAVLLSLKEVDGIHTWECLRAGTLK